LLAAYKRLVPAALDQGKSVCIAVFDLDHFKQVNDGFGHDAGDQVLQSFAGALRSAVRENDVVARLGGEEFAALLVGVDIEQAHRICDRVRQDFRLQRFSFGEGRVLQVTVSGGLSEITPPWGSLEKAVKMADMALYQAKTTGRDRLAIAA
jgi:diguanylate cyclase (GGDEF)-like protein